MQNNQEVRFAEGEIALLLFLGKKLEKLAFLCRRYDSQERNAIIVVKSGGKWSEMGQVGERTCSWGNISILSMTKEELLFLQNFEMA